MKTVKAIKAIKRHRKKTLHDLLKQGRYYEHYKLLHNVTSEDIYNQSIKILKEWND